MSDAPVHSGPVATRPSTARRAAGQLALAAGTVRVGLELWGMATSSAGTPVWLYLPMLAGGLVAIAGGLLVSRDDERGVGVLVVAGASAAVALVGSGPALIATGPILNGLWLLALVALVVSAVLAWRARDRARWAPVEHTVRPVYLAAAMVAVLGAVLPAVTFAERPIGGAPWWQPVLSGGSGNGITVVGTVAWLLVLAALLAVATFLARPVAGAVVGAIAVTGLGSAASALLQATWAADLRFTLVGWLDLAANAVLLAIAVRWWSPPELDGGQPAAG